MIGQCSESPEGILNNSSSMRGFSFNTPVKSIMNGAVEPRYNEVPRDWEHVL